VTHVLGGSCVGTQVVCEQGYRPCTPRQSYDLNEKAFSTLSMPTCWHTVQFAAKLSCSSTAPRETIHVRAVPPWHLTPLKLRFPRVLGTEQNSWKRRLDGRLIMTLLHGPHPELVGATTTTNSCIIGLRVSILPFTHQRRSPFTGRYELTSHLRQNTKWRMVKR